MAAEPLRVVVQHLRRLVGAPASGAVTDGQLLERFVHERDHAAFELLVRRHERMVWGVCRRLLHEPHDTEDAFQATFLVLVRKAGTVARKESVASWLYKVAYRVALGASIRRRQLMAREKRGIDLSWVADPHEGASEMILRDVRPLLDQEVSRLPEKYRAPFVLCYLEGQSYEEVAQQLGCPKGTVSTRLTRARELLRGRLARRGLAVTVGVLTTALSQDIAKGSVPAALVGSTIKAGLSLATGTAPATLSASVQALAEGVIKAMFVTQLKTAATVVLALSILATGAGLVAHQAWGAKQPIARHDDSPPSRNAAAAPSARAEEKSQPRTDRYGDPLPPGALARLGTVRFRHGDQIAAIAYSPDGKTIASGGLGGYIRLWDAASGKPYGTLTGQNGWVFSLAFSADGKRLVSAGGNYIGSVQFNRQPGKLILWDLGAERPVFSVNHHQGWVRSAALSSDGQKVAMGCDDGSLVLLDAATGKELHNFGKPTGTILGLAFSPDSRLLAAPGGKNTIQLWDTTTCQQHLKIQGPGDPRALAFSPDGKSLAAAHVGAQFLDDGSICVWDVATGKELHTLRGHKGTIFSVSFSPDGKRLASGGMHGMVMLWDLQSGKQLRTHQFLNSWFQSVAFAPDGKSLAAGSSSGRIQVWDVLTGEEQFVFEEHTGLSRIALSPDASTLATASADQTVRLWNLNTARPSAILRGFGAAIYTVDFAADGKRLAISGDDGSVRLLSATTGKEEGHLDLPAKNACARAVYSPSGRLLVTGGIQNIRLWDAVTGNQIRQLKGHDGLVQALTFSPDETLLASVAHSFGGQNGHHEDYTVRIWNVADGRQLHRFEQMYAWEPSFRPDGRVLAYLAQDERRMRCRDVITGKERPGVPDTDLTAYAFSPEGQWLATAHVGGTIRVREQATGHEILHFQTTPSAFSQLIWAADGKKLFSNNGDATVLIWDLTPPDWDLGHRQKAFQPEQLERAWLDLKAQDAKEAYRAAWLLTAAGDDAVALLRRRLQSATDIGNAERIRSLVADLDHQQFARREAASRQLAELGAAAEPALIRTLANQPSAEVRSRVEALLNQLADHEKQPTPDELRRDRALAVVERIASPAARQVLENLAKGASEVVMGQKAEAALRRLTRRPAAAP